MSLEIPICTFDAKTGLLCPVCQAKADSGQLSPADIETSKALVSIADRFRAMGSVSLVKSHKVGSDYLIEVREGGLPVLRDREIRSELEQILGGRLWVAGASGSNRRLVEDLLYPLKVLGFSTVWLPDGSGLTKVLVESAGRKMARRLEVAAKMLKAARSIEMVIDFDDAPALNGRERAGYGSWVLPGNDRPIVAPALRNRREQSNHTPGESR